MAKTRALVKRRKAIRNIRKITRTMELIATARFKKAIDRAVAGGRLHAQDRRAGRRPERQRHQHQASAAGEARDDQEQPAAGALLQSRPVRRLQRQHSSRGQRRHSRDPGARDRHCTWNCPASGPSPTSATRALPPRRPTRTSRTSRASRRSRSSPTATSRLTSPARSIGWRSAT